MALRAGERLGPYEILGGLGAGGMGEVYRARDPRLGRVVAIKVLPSSVAADPSRRRRFEQEARAAGLLNHPNILAVHDVGDHEGAPYLIAELLEGETLRERLHSGALPVRKAVEYALQLARGLAAAHDKGIVHRDLKPENLFLTKDGIVKILDFGLARLERVAPTGTEAPATLTQGTDPGTVMGTVGYMSPEQVRGESADARSDLFALGAVLYELLTGRRAFQKDTSVGTLNAILTEEPPELPADARIPTPLDRLVRHCLEKKPEDRFQSARDLAYELEGLAGSSAGVAGAVASARHPWPRWLAGATLGLLALAAAFVAGRQAVVPSPLRYQRLTFRRGTVWSARFAPDARTIVYGAAWEGQPIRVFTAVPGSPEPRALDLPDADLLAVSSRGELALALDRYRYTYLGYGRGTLATVPLAGGSPRALLEGVNGADWSPDGRELALAIREGRSDSRLEYPQGRVLCRQELPVICPRVSPGADVVAFLERGAVHVVDTGGAKRRLSPLPPRWSNRLAWSPRGDEVWFGGSLRGDEWAIYAVDLQGRTRLVADLPFVGHLLDVSADGRALLTLADERGAMTANAPGTPREKDLSWLDWSYPLQISRDGRTLLFGEAGQGGSRTQSLYVRPMDGSAPAVRVAEGSNAFDKAALSPDAKWLLVWQPERPAELRLLPSGPGEQTTIRGQGIEFASTELLGLERATFVLPDGRRVVAPGREPGRPWRSWVQDVAGGPARPFTPEGTLAEAISPDGTLAVARDGERRLVLYPVEGGRPRPVPGPPEPGRILEWANDGRALFIEETHDARGLASHILRRDLGTGRRELWREERPGDQAGLSSVRCVISGGGRSYACSQTRMLSSLFLVEGLK